MKKNILILSDNEYHILEFGKIAEIRSKELKDYNLVFAFSRRNHALALKYADNPGMMALDLKTDDTDNLIRNFHLIISLHCKQIFPSELVKSVKCINVHPGLNPYNRGWYPQIFSIINGMPCGVTIHEMDDMTDHGPIIAQVEVPISGDDTSLTVYQRILEAEISLLKDRLIDILEGDYTTFVPKEGNLNTIMDFRKLCEINLDEMGCFRDFLNRLRALSHGDYDNAYFYDGTGEKMYVKIHLKCQKQKNAA